MTREQKEKLTAWCLNLLVTYRIDFFRGLALSYTVNFLKSGDPDRIEIAIESLRVADNHDFEPDPKDYTELLRELREVAKEVPLSDTAQSAITFVFGGEWEEAIEALDKLKYEDIDDRIKDLDEEPVRDICRVIDKIQQEYNELDDKLTDLSEAVEEFTKAVREMKKEAQQ